VAVWKQRFYRWFWPFVLAVGVLATAVLAWVTRTPRAIASTGECWTLAPVPGPEDLVIAPGREAALVSSQDRRADPMLPGAIWYVPLDTAASSGPPRRLTLRGRDDCSFHPHGIDLSPRAGDTALLYVINHHEPSDLAVSSGCFDATGRTKPRTSVTSVEVFEYRGGELYFLQRLADPDVLTGGNDLVAEDDGDLWVTVPPRSALGFLAEVVGGARSKIVHFDCRPETGSDGRCVGRWSDVELLFPMPARYANGIEIDRGAEPRRLYLASTGDRHVRVAAIERREGPDAEGATGTCREPPCLRELGHRCVGGMPDNLSWSEHGELLVATHTDPRRYLQHSRSPGTPSPWSVVSLPEGDPPGGPRCAEREPTARLLQGAGGRASAVSVAASIGDDLVLGQVYGPGVVRCRPHRSAAEIGGTP
jgi:hypothetical protein